MRVDLRKALSVSDESMQSRARLKGIMRDLYPEDRREVNILLSVYESGAPSRIAKKGSITAEEYKIFLGKIIEEYAMQEHYAMQALDAWIDVLLGVGTAAGIRKDMTGLPLRGVPVCAPGCHETLYSYQKILHGYAITKYTGFDEAVIRLPDTYRDQPVLRIAREAFCGCRTIRHVFLGKHIKVLETGAFRGCRSLERVYGSEQLEYIGESAFAGCESLSEINVSDAVYYLGKQAFAHTAIQSFAIPKSLDYVSTDLFQSCHKLGEVAIHSQVIALGAGCFRDCGRLDNVVVPAGVNYIGQSAFMNCTGLRSLTIASQNAVFKDSYALKEAYVWQPDHKNIAKTRYRSLPDLTVICCPGSTAQIYCIKENIRCAKLDREEPVQALGSLEDPIGIWVKMRRKSDLKEKKTTVMRAIEESGEVIVEHGEEESIIIFKHPEKISRHLIENLLTEYFKKRETDIREPFVIPYTKEQLVRKSADWHKNPQDCTC